MSVIPEQQSEDPPNDPFAFLDKSERWTIERLGHGEPDRCACIAHELTRRLSKARAQAMSSPSTGKETA